MRTAFNPFGMSKKMFNFCPDFSKAFSVSMPFTAQETGWFIAHNVNTSTVVYVNGISVAQGNWQPGAWSGNLDCQILINKGDVVSGATGTMRFIPCKGKNKS